MTPRMLEVVEIAAVLRKTPRTIREMIGRGELPAHRIGSSYRIEETMFNRWLAERVVSTGK